MILCIKNGFIQREKIGLNSRISPLRVDATNTKTKRINYRELKQIFKIRFEACIFAMRSGKPRLDFKVD